MSSLAALGRLAARRRRLVIVGALAFVLVASLVGANVVERLSSAGFDAPGSESVRAGETLKQRFGVDVPQLVMLASARRSVDDPNVSRAGVALTERLKHEPGIVRVDSYWTARVGAERLKSRDGRSALIVAWIAGDDDKVTTTAKRLVPNYAGRRGPLTVGVTGAGALISATERQVTHDLARAEMIAVPLTLLALILVFRGLIAALLPLSIGVVASVGTFAMLRLISEVAPVSIFALNLATALSLGLAVDYSLFVVARYREELDRGLDPPDAIAATMASAGRTVLFSSVTVAISLAGLLVFPMYYLRSFAYAGVSVVAIAALGTLVLLPALLAVTGKRIDSLALHAPRRTRLRVEDGQWYRLARRTMRHPLPVVAAAVAFLLLLGAPFLHANLGFSDDRNLPAGAPVRQVSDAIRAGFSERPDSTLYVLAERAGRSGAVLQSYAARVSRLDGVTGVELGPRLRSDGSTFLVVHNNREPYGLDGERLVRALRAMPAPVPVQVTGLAALGVDTKQVMAQRLPLAIAVIVITTFLALLAMTGSVLAPIKALAINALSLSAVFGALVYVFQEGHLRWLMGNFTVTDSINVLNPPLIFCIAFGLAMDYEVFLLSRIKEEHDDGRDNATAIAGGVQRAAPIITAAAGVMAIVFVAFSTSGVTNVKMIGAGLALAVVIEATIVRALLVPAFMRLAGRWNWWAPSPVRRLQGRLGWVRGEPLFVDSRAAP